MEEIRTTSWGKGSLSRYLPGFLHPRCRISNINSIWMIRKGMTTILQVLIIVQVRKKGIHKFHWKKTGDCLCLERSLTYRGRKCIDDADWKLTIIKYRSRKIVEWMNLDSRKGQNIWYIWVFPKMVVPPNHPFLEGFPLLSIHFGVPYMYVLQNIFSSRLHHTHRPVIQYWRSDQPVLLINNPST